MLISWAAGPVNSRDLYCPPSALISPKIRRITSLLITPSLKWPFNTILIASGTLNHSSPVIRAAAISAVPIPEQKLPAPPYVVVWLSVAVAISPGFAYFASCMMVWQMPSPICSFLIPYLLASSRPAS